MSSNEYQTVEDSLRPGLTVFFVITMCVLAFTLLHNIDTITYTIFGDQREGREANKNTDKQHREDLNKLWDTRHEWAPEAKQFVSSVATTAKTNEASLWSSYAGKFGESPCQRCSGSGKYGPAKCQRCWGIGREPIWPIDTSIPGNSRIREKPCSDCQGTGTQDGETVCPECFGNGCVRRDRYYSPSAKTKPKATVQPNSLPTRSVANFAELMAFISNSNDRRLALVNWGPPVLTDLFGDPTKPEIDALQAFHRYVWVASGHPRVPGERSWRADCKPESLEQWRYIRAAIYYREELEKQGYKDNFVGDYTDEAIDAFKKAINSSEAQQAFKERKAYLEGLIEGGP